MTMWRRAWATLTEPTLVRRSTWSVLLTFVVIWAVLLGYVYALARDALNTAPNLERFGHALVAALAQIDDGEQARVTLAATDHWVNARRADDDRFTGVFLFSLRDQQGRTVRAAPALDAVPLAGNTMSVAKIAGVSHFVFEGSAGCWVLRIAVPRRTHAAFLAYNARFLVPYLLIAAPFVLLAVWLSVRNGLLPLQRLAERTAARDPDDLNPTGFAARHRELRPLVRAMDTLLANARQRVQREAAFVQDAAHELRTPLAVITAEAHVLARSDDPAERDEAARQLQQAVQRAAHLSRQLLELARLDETARAGQAAPTVADFSACLRDTLAQAYPAAQARGIDLALEAPEHLLLSVDLAALQSIAGNLVDNAIRYGAAGGQVQVTLSGGPAGAWSLSVQDDGPGIAPSERERVFERFHRGTDVSAPGAGLGLAIVRRAALRLGGGVRMTDGLQGRGVGFVVEVLGNPPSGTR